MSAAGDILRRARARIAAPEKWLRGAWAKVGNDPVFFALNLEDIDERAACFCGMGAVLVEPLTEAREQAVVALTRAVGVEGAVSPELEFGAWNDAAKRTHADVLAAYDRAIAIADAEGA